ncbi:hypothetical protein Barb4_01074 [Bacteroidales bacterium Barb4]|nr:hypothetical protein Barb4_01074 [Bacteroidales bacterium Barb4]
MRRPYRCFGMLVRVCPDTGNNVFGRVLRLLLHNIIISSAR